MRLMRPAVPITALLLILAACGGDTAEDGTTTSVAETGGDSEVAMRAISFLPNEITVDTGTTVTWTNDDSVAHTATSDDDIWDSGTMSVGDEFSFTFDEAGTFTYFCTIHPQQMQATVIVEG